VSVAGKGDRNRFDAPNMFMAMYSKPIGDRSQWGFRAMASLDPLTQRGYGYPLLYQSGELFDGEPMHDRQHPHDFISELAGTFSTKVGEKQSFFVYGGIVGEPALGPPMFMHRPSAANNPDAPIGHHWQDASHGSYCVASVVIDVSRMSLGASAFNARESDFQSPWPDYTQAQLDSYSGRATIDLHPVSISGWWGYLKGHDPIAPAMQMHRYGASASFQARGLRGGAWSSLAVWGMNVHHHDGASHLLLHGDPNASPHVWSSKRAARPLAKRQVNCCSLQPSITKPASRASASQVARLGRFAAMCASSRCGTPAPSRSAKRSENTW
jgi:hypothetical protein